MLTNKEKLFSNVKTTCGISKHNNLFRKLHYVFGFDYNKPFDSVLIEGRFTINNVKKAVNHDSTKTTVVLVQGTTGFNEGSIRCAIVNNDSGGFSIDINERLCPWSVGYFQLSFDTYFRKGDFEVDRKNNLQALVISQENKYLSGTGYPSTRDALSDNNERFKPGRVINGANMAGTIKYISQIDFYPVHSHGEKYDYHAHGQVIYSQDIEKYPKTVLDVFDRSGYYVFDRRENLKRRAAAARAEKQKAAVISRDFSKELRELEKLRENALALFASKAATVRTTEQLDYFNKKIDGYIDGLRWIMFDNDQFIDRVNNNKYSSIEKAAAAFNDIKCKYAAFIDPDNWNF